MEKKFCQSCSMPIDNPEWQGTEKDGSKNEEYCMYCYQNGAFIRPDMTIADMKEVVTTEMKKKQIDESLIKMAVDSLPHLKRWAGTTAII